MNNISGNVAALPVSQRRKRRRFVAKVEGGDIHSGTGLLSHMREGIVHEDEPVLVFGENGMVHVIEKIVDHGPLTHRRTVLPPTDGISRVRRARALRILMDMHE